MQSDVKNGNSLSVQGLSKKKKRKKSNVYHGKTYFDQNLEKAVNMNEIIGGTQQMQNQTNT